LAGKGLPLRNHSEDSLEKYLHEISKVPLLSPEEEIELARRIRKGDQEALEKLTKANLRFVVSVAKQYQSYGLSLGDLIDEGNLGLIKAANRFDETRGFKFISYAVWWIRQSILQALAEHSRIIRLPLNRIGILNKIEKIFSSLEQKYEREPSAAEIAEVLEISPSEVIEALNSTNPHISLDSSIDQDDDTKLVDVIENAAQEPPDVNLLDESLRIEIERALKSLDEREAEVLRLYFGIEQEHPLTLEEIGQKFNLTRERVRQIKEKAITRLRHTTRSQALRTFLG